MWSTSDKHFISGVRADIERALDLATTPAVLDEEGLNLLCDYEEIMGATVSATIRVYGSEHPLVTDAAEAHTALRWRISTCA